MAPPMVKAAVNAKVNFSMLYLISEMGSHIKSYPGRFLIVSSLLRVSYQSTKFVCPFSFLLTRLPITGRPVLARGGGGDDSHPDDWRSTVCRKLYPFPTNFRHGMQEKCSFEAANYKNFRGSMPQTPGDRAPSALA